ncbi:MAG: helix-turn-helix transcriptional regulator [Gammaproteobacteria bacterium]|nr:helix-turn-helix transcriptional regulator [Gammaproteobacteria bacterium]MDP2140084.1 helix-turn-helix transcriptional regulator [Gammaproteobacteria bacterium]MDP2347646.1 helix-turn-helix transcriptional regulator [Gammaproteobacteria bacterium]
MQLIQYATSFMAISQLLFMALFYLAYFRRQLLGKLMAFYAVCLIGYILATLPEVDNAPWIFDFVLSLLAITTPALLWVITRYLFEDEPQVDPLVWITIALYITLRAFAMVMGPQEGVGYWLHSFLPQVIMLGFACHVVYTAVRGLGSDLVEPRRQLRVPFAITMGSIVAIILGSYFLNLTDRWIYNVYIGAIFLFILFFNLASFRVHRDSPQLIDTVVIQPSVVPPHSGRVSEKDKDKPLIDRIHSVMENDRLFAQPGLTIGQLAASVSMQEYRLRRLINQKLHYRNFNQYLNQYRIAEAARRLQDPAESHLPISTIALDVGYASLSSFNKAFKEAHGVTPSIFRSRTPQQ